MVAIRAFCLAGKWLNYFVNRAGLVIVTVCSLRKLQLNADIKFWCLAGRLRFSLIPHREVRVQRRKLRFYSNVEKAFNMLLVLRAGSRHLEFDRVIMEMFYDSAGTFWAQTRELHCNFLLFTLLWRSWAECFVHVAVVVYFPNSLFTSQLFCVCSVVGNSVSSIYIRYPFTL
jgi:hypothetical protein